MYRCSMGVQLRRGVNANAPKFTGVLRWHRDAHSELVRWCVNARNKGRSEIDDGSISSNVYFKFHPFTF